MIFLLYENRIWKYPRPPYLGNTCHIINNSWIHYMILHEWFWCVFPSFLYMMWHLWCNFGTKLNIYHSFLYLSCHHLFFKLDCLCGNINPIIWQILTWGMNWKKKFSPTAWSSNRFCVLINLIKKCWWNLMECNQTLWTRWNLESLN